MVEVSRKVKIYRKPSVSGFDKVNRVQIALSYDTKSKIGASISATNAMLKNGDELKMLMPSMLGLSANSPTWDDKVNLYWNSLAKQVPETTGLELEVGFRYTLDDNSREVYLKKLTSCKDDSALAEYGEKQKEEDKWKFGTPINVEQYLLWRYCLVYGDVANDVADIDKSPKIRFYIFDDTLRKKAEEERFKLETQANMKFYEILVDKDKINNILSVFGHNVLGFKNEVHKQSTLKKIVEAQPLKFLAVESDKQLQMKSFIERCIINNLLKRYANTTAVVDVDSLDTIGTTLDAAIVYLNDAKHKDVLSRLQTQLMLKDKEVTTLPK